MNGTNMLVKSNKHTKKDLATWERNERFDQNATKRNSYIRYEQNAMNEIKKFLESGPCYVGVSWGKDSVVVAHLVIETCRKYNLALPPIVWILVEPIYNPDCLKVRDVFFQIMPYAKIAYHEIVEHCRLDETGFHAKGTLERGFKEASVIAKSKRHISGIRGEESTGRKMRMQVFGQTTKNTCAPIGWWKAQHVFAYLYKYKLPVHPAYAMSWGDTLERGRLRVASLGGERGTGKGRREWENYYYRETIDKIENLEKRNNEKK